MNGWTIKKTTLNKIVIYTATAKNALMDYIFISLDEAQKFCKKIAPLETQNLPC